MMVVSSDHAPPDQALTDQLLSAPLDELMAQARALRMARSPAAPTQLTWSRKIFIPLTRLCADVCHYCTFATTPADDTAPFLSPEDVLALARAGKAAGCKEALITLGDAPERRYHQARTWLAQHGFARTLDYVRHCAELVLQETGLLPHINAGLMVEEDYQALKPFAPSCGLMLESVAERLCAKGGPHYGSPDKLPAARLASLAAAGRAHMVMTSGILAGIGETGAERIASLLALRDLHRHYGHLQEVIIQNFRPKPGTRMAGCRALEDADFLRTVAAARIILPGDVSIQVPPNLNSERLRRLIEAGMDDWGGISPVTIDHVNPEAPWPEIRHLEQVCQGWILAERLAIHPRFARDAFGIGAPQGWVTPALAPYVLKLADSQGLARDSQWSPGVAGLAPGTPAHPLGQDASGCGAGQGRAERGAEQGAGHMLHRLVDHAANGGELSEDQIVTLFAARGDHARMIVDAADALRAQAVGDVVGFVVNRNINYTNICTYGCSFCAFSKTSIKAGLRDRPYNHNPAELADMARDAVAKGASEVCLQGGIHPAYTGETYAGIIKAVKTACPGLHIHAFSPLEVAQGARTLNMPLVDYLIWLKELGLGSLPGTAAEILCDEVRARICPDKLTTAEWLDVIGTAHRVGLPTTATIMFGHCEGPEHWARHLLTIRRQQSETGGFTEFVPLPLVHMEAPMYRRGQSRQGPTWREVVLMYAIARIVLHGQVANIQASWVKLGLPGAAAVLRAGCNDLGGILMHESISRAAGATHGQDVSITDLATTAANAGRTLQQRTTLYQQAGGDASWGDGRSCV